MIVELELLHYYLHSVTVHCSDIMTEMAIKFDSITTVSYVVVDPLQQRLDCVRIIFNEIAYVHSGCYYE